MGHASIPFSSTVSVKIDEQEMLFNFCEIGALKQLYPPIAQSRTQSLKQWKSFFPRSCLLPSSGLSRNLRKICINQNLFRSFTYADMPTTIHEYISIFGVQFRLVFSSVFFFSSFRSGIVLGILDNAVSLDNAAKGRVCVYSSRMCGKDSN